MKKYAFTAAVASLLLSLSSIAHADTLTGQVQEIDTAGRSIKMVSVGGSEAQATEYKVVWDETLLDAPKLQSTRVGDALTLDATQNPITQNWKVNSVRGPLSAVDNALHPGSERMISGEITTIDLPGNSLVLISEDMDGDGKRIEYRVVWDNTNVNVRNRLEKSKIGDNISLEGDRNVVTGNWKAVSVAGPIESLAAKNDHVLVGEVKRVEPEKNFILLSTTDESGREAERKLVWDKDFAEQARLENAQIGQKLSVQADRNVLTGNWKVKALA